MSSCLFPADFVQVRSILINVCQIVPESIDGASSNDGSAKERMEYFEAIPSTVGSC